MTRFHRDVEKDVDINVDKSCKCLIVTILLQNEPYLLKIIYQ